MKTTSYPAPQAEGFSFSEENRTRAETVCARYPADRKASATIALLDLAQRQNGGWLSPECIEYVAAYLEIAPIRAYEVASFYSMFNTKPVGKYFIQVCRTTPCWLRGSDGITETCKKKLGVGLREVTGDGLFSVIEVECLGACANAPMAQINDFYYEDLTPERMAEIIDELRAGEEVKVGSQTGRLASAPEGGPQTLLNVPAHTGGDD
jgi:NADH-quinone oxidoreductase E subunit